MRVHIIDKDSDSTIPMTEYSPRDGIPRVGEYVWVDDKVGQVDSVSHYLRKEKSGEAKVNRVEIRLKNVTDESY